MNHPKRSQGRPLIFELSGSTIHSKLTCFLVIFFTHTALLPLSFGANDSTSNSKQSKEAIAAQRKRADGLLDAAEQQLKNKTYELANKTLERCRDLNGGLRSSQNRRLNKYVDQAQEGAEAQTKANAYIQKGSAALKAENYAESLEAFESAKALREHLPSITLSRVIDNLKVIEKQQANLKSDMVALYKKSVKDFKGEEFAQAQKGFTAVKKSGVKLGFFATGKFSSADAYLNKIAKAVAETTNETAQAKEQAAQTSEEEKLAALQDTQNRVEQQKKQASIDLYKQSVKDYKSSQLDAAESGFRKVIENGFKLGLLERGGDVSDANAYLAKINKQRAMLAQVEAKARAQQVRAETKARKEQARVKELQTKKDAKAATELRVPDATPDQPVAISSKTKKSAWPFGRKREALSAEDHQRLGRLLKNGDTAIGNKKYSQAKEYFNQALTLDPENAKAIEGKNTASYLAKNTPSISGTTEKQSILDIVRDREQVQIQEVESSVTTTRLHVIPLIEQKSFERARGEVNLTLARIETAKQLLGAERYKILKSSIHLMLEDIRDKEEAYLISQDEQKRQTAKAKEDARRKRVETERNKKIEQLMETAENFRETQEFNLALKALDQLLELDPKNIVALNMRKDMGIMQLLQRQRDTRSVSTLEEKKTVSRVGGKRYPLG